MTEFADSEGHTVGNVPDAPLPPESWQACGRARPNTCVTRAAAATGDGSHRPLVLWSAVVVVPGALAALITQRLGHGDIAVVAVATTGGFAFSRRGP
jgi:hypothetical protein